MRGPSTPRRRRPTTSTSPSPARTCTATTAPASSSGTPRARSSSWCATPTGIRGPTTAPPTWTRSRSGRATATRSPPRAACSPAARLVLGDTAAPGAGGQGGARTPSRPDRVRARRRLPLRRDQHHDQAVRQPRRPQGGRGRRGPPRAAALARRRRRRAAGDALPAAGLPRPCRGRRGQGHRRRLPRQPARGHGRGQALHARGQARGPGPADRLRRPVDRRHGRC